MQLVRPLLIGVGAPIGVIAIFFAATKFLSTPSTPRYANQKDAKGNVIKVNSIATVKEGEDYSLAFIEFGEHGSFQDPSQLEQAENLIASKSKPFVIMYVHGWHHNSGSGDVEKFRDFLNELTDYKTVKDWKLDVVGVYLAWRGESCKDVGPLKSLTFWNRKAAAERLASNGDCIDSIWSLTNTARRRKDVNGTVLMGHSFGGLIVERTVAHS